jgi:hypothetical protein
VSRHPLQSVSRVKKTDETPNTRKTTMAKTDAYETMGLRRTLHPRVEIRTDCDGQILVFIPQYHAEWSEVAGTLGAEWLPGIREYGFPSGTDASRVEAALTQVFGAEWDRVDGPNTLPPVESPFAGLVVRGETYPIRDELRAIGFRWDPNAREWHLGETVSEQADALVRDLLDRRARGALKAIEIGDYFDPPTRR